MLLELLSSQHLKTVYVNLMIHQRQQYGGKAGGRGSADLGTLLDWRSPA
jgi:hypothetical protein